MKCETNTEFRLTNGEASILFETLENCIQKNELFSIDKETGI